MEYFILAATVAVFGLLSAISRGKQPLVAFTRMLVHCRAGFLWLRVAAGAVRSVGYRYQECLEHARRAI